jgi:recombination protein RecR
MNFSSPLLEKAVAEFEKLPGIGKKTALRLVLHLLRQEKESVTEFSNAISRLRNEIRYCRTCFNLSDEELCSICRNPRRNTSVVCVVENIREVMAIENTHQFTGLYHVLGGVISPMDGIGPDQLRIDSLIERCRSGEIRELIMALSPTVEGDTTVFYLARKLKDSGIKITTLARGVAFGGELEYVDDVTLGRSLTARIPYENGASGEAG